MGRLIDVDELRADYGMAEDCKDCKAGYRSCEYDRSYSKMDFCGWLDDAPTVDAVPVQRCDGCRYADWHSNGCIAYCTKHGTDGHVADSFCSEGEKDGDND